jgi:lipopolysaccharide/colanic/teichoic acid biosynthesis glycosyltransferase
MVTPPAVDGPVELDVVDPACAPPVVPVKPLPLWKRAFDLAVAGSLLVVVSPVALLVAAANLAVMGRPLLYRQARGGLGGSTFEILKFRTMLSPFNDEGRPLSDEERRVPWGNVMRRTSLDEIPTLINILKGDMSIVGPRPLLARYLDRYDERQARRHCVTPGVTGLAQTKGRNKLDWSERFELDLEYVETRSVATDLAILLDTVKVVLSRDGADGYDHCTEFKGSIVVEIPAAAVTGTVEDEV